MKKVLTAALDLVDSDDTVDDDGDYDTNPDINETTALNAVTTATPPNAAVSKYSAFLAALGHPKE